MDTAQLQDSYRAFLDAAATLASARDRNPVPAPGEWDAGQVLAHVSLISAATIAAVSSAAAGTVTTYDNRTALDPWTLERVTGLAGGSAGLRDRVLRQGEALCALSGPILSEAELNTAIPALLLSNGKVLVDQPMALRDILTGLANVELPGHTRQLLALLADGTDAW